MAFQYVDKIRIRGTAVAIPKSIISNHDYEVIPEDQRERFIETIGIDQRHCVKQGTCTSDLCFAAAEHLIDKLNWDKNEIDLIVFVSQTPDYKMPSTACILQDRLGLKKSIMAFDISQGCTGFIYGLGVVGTIVSASHIKKALLLVGNTQSLNTSYYDKSTYPLFGDAGSAAAIEYSEEEYDSLLLGYYTDGSGAESIIIPDGGYRNPTNQESYQLEQFEGGIQRNRLHLRMAGDDVFSFVLSQVPKVIKSILTNANKSIEDIDFLLLHQASLFTCESLRKKLKFPTEKTPYILREYGNCSNASIPLIMAHMLRKQCIEGNSSILMASFGVGLSIACGLIELSGLDVCDSIEV